MSLVRLRMLLEKNFRSFQHVVIIGGLVRDLARKGVVGFRSDIDFVIDAPKGEVAALARQLNAQPNRFGGYAYHHPNWKLDFWALETTWAATSGYVQIDDLSDLTKCTFFDWDAVLYDLWGRKVISGSGYLETLRRNEMEINLLPTPSINGNLLRSIRRLLLWNIEAGPQLKEFIVENLDAENFQIMSNAERSIFGNSVLGIFANFEILSSHLFDLEARTSISTSFAKQLPLPGI